MSSGGGKASTPTLLDDNLKSKQFYRVLDLISEGPIYGPIDQSHLSSFRLNKTPVTDANGNVSVNGISVAWRPGSENQLPINGFSAIEATTIVNTEVTYDTPLVRTITDQDVTRVRFNIGTTGLVEQDTKGNQKNTSVTMVIESRTGSTGWVIEKNVTIGPGKISGEYLEAHLIDAPDTKPFDIRVRRITPDSTSDLLSNGTIWNSYSEITDDNLNYPFSAIAGAVIDRDQYTDTPSRTYHLRGLIVDVPDNYDPITRTYSGLWTGGFKKSWTNNPAWLFRELAKNTRFGLAKRAGYIDVDDGALYVLSRYCDQLVNDGYGGQEPRMTLNAYITEQASARDILDKIASMFRGIALWDGMRLSVMLDAPQDPIATITNANVVDGEFKRSSVKRSEKYNAVVVSWTDPDNGWEQVKEYVSDDEMIARGNYNETTIEAFGCTSRGQAWRAGKWLLETAKRESSRLSFQMARDAIHFTPGDIVEIMDNNYAGARLGGRIMSHAGNKITVDAVDSSLISEGDTMSIMGSDGKFVKFEIGSIADNIVTLKTTPAWIRDGTVFAISTSNVSTRLFRILSVAETDNNSVYSITASQHDPNKQAIVDEGAVFDVPSDTLNGYRVPNVENLRIINTNSETVQVTATWETATTTKKLMFEVYVYTDDGKVVAQYETDQFRYEFFGLNAGSYTLGVRGRNENGMKGAETQISMVIGAPPAPSSVIWTPGLLSADLVPVMRITATTDTSFEFWYSGLKQIENPADIEDQTQFLGRSNQWTLHGLQADKTYYVYVRTRNAFGVSEFVEASGQASSDIPGMIDLIDEQIRESDAFKNVQEGVDTNLEGILQNALANNGTVERQFQQLGEVNAEILTVRTTIATVDSALAQLTTSVKSQFDGVNSQILEQKTAISDNKKAIASLNTYVQAQFGDVTAAINQKLDAEVTNNGTGKVSYTLNLGVIRNGVKYNTGFGMSIEPSGGSYKSTVVFAADQFGIYSGSDPGNYQAAFFVYNGQVFIRDALIQDGSIDNAKIGQYIQSNVYTPGSVGWHINKNGNSEFNNVTVRGTVYASDGEFTGKVRAKSFIGDIINANVFNDIKEETKQSSGSVALIGSISRNYYFTDSATDSLSKTVIFDIILLSGMVSGSGSYIDVTININGTKKTTRRSDGGTVPVRFSVKGVTTPNVTVELTLTYYIPAGAIRTITYGVSSPMISIVRGSGSFRE
ncbi:phage tail protein [Citrobacter freundii]|uniref:host specificity protein J n=1 Tax=Citrobacter freundii TaxID=546 RepID=UPI001BCD1A51|nr:phage tail protein [Citrobacter freundii]MDV0831870.1 phage tail protein [Citrobacter freundii]MDV0867485.1 phage tail protein [Citrobacter freundii]MDV0901721.1 phage tail protein [Citrobacter freundii]MDV1666462.1 phage tail protein [Citrobacter freundii]MDV1705021.1 phage tail protein [Citrobacter freundii]